MQLGHQDRLHRDRGEPGFVVTEYSDGTVTMTAANGGESGATGSFGAVVARGEQAGAKVNFGGELEFDHGSTWHLESTEQAKEFRAQLDDYLFDQWSLTHPMCSPMGGMCWPRPLKGTDPPPVPSTPFGGIAPTADVTADPGISATTRTSPLSQAETPLRSSKSQAVERADSLRPPGRDGRGRRPAPRSRGQLG